MPLTLISPVRNALGLIGFTLALLAGCASPTATAPQAAPEAAPQAQACPAGVPAGARCLRGQDSASSHYLIVMPAQWSGVLVVHAHGGPSLGPPQAARADEDIKRWAITVREGHAWAGSVFRQGGFAVRTAAEDSERVRRIFVQHVAQPRRTLLHGQSWGAAVAAQAAEMFPKSWDGVLLTSGVVAGTSTYDFRLDLRAVYQHLCNNHPLPSEAAYALNIGLPKGSPLTRPELERRVEACLGVRLPAAQRTPEQARALQTITSVIRIPASAIQGHMNWATWSLQDVVEKVGGASPLGNQSVRYVGSSDDAALNLAVPRFQADAAAKARFEADTNHAGRFRVPVLSAHGINDATVFVESQHHLRARMAAAGTEHQLVQNFVDSAEHSYWGDELYPPLFEALLAWVEKGAKPTPAGIATRCRALAAAAPDRCRFVPDYAVKPLASRVAPR
jgi:pimeloyl-ACP methyl ester carboxylesterase